MNLERLTKFSTKFALRLKRSGKSSWRSVAIADISWYVLGKNVVVKDLNMLDDDDDEYDDGDGVGAGNVAVKDVLNMLDHE